MIFESDVLSHFYCDLCLAQNNELEKVTLPLEKKGDDAVCPHCFKRWPIQPGKRTTL